MYSCACQHSRKKQACKHFNRAGGEVGMGGGAHCSVSSLKKKRSRLYAKMSLHCYQWGCPCQEEMALSHFPTNYLSKANAQLHPSLEHKYYHCKLLHSVCFNNR